jgi:hypothetical protein
MLEKNIFYYHMIRHSHGYIEKKVEIHPLAILVALLCFIIIAFAFTCVFM